MMIQKETNREQLKEEEALENFSDHKYQFTVYTLNMIV